MVNKMIFPLMFLLVFSNQLYAKKLRIYLDWYPSIEFAGMFLADERGWYQRAGIEVEYIFEGLNITENVLAGKADIGMHSAQDIIKHVGKGARLKAFAAKYQLNPNCMIVNPQLKITTLKDLKGKTLGVWAPQDLDFYKVVLGYNGLSLEDVVLKKVTTFREKTLIEYLKKGHLDAFLGWEFDWTITFSLLGYPGQVFPGHDNGFHFFGIVYFAAPEYIKENREVLASFLYNTFKGWKEVYSNPDKHTRWIVNKWYPKDRYIDGSKELTVKQQRLELILRKRHLFEGVGYEKMGFMLRYKWKKSLEIAKKYGIYNPDVSLTIDDVADFSVVELLEEQF